MFRQPTKPDDEIVAHERDQNVAGAVQNGSDLEKGQQQSKMGVGDSIGDRRDQRFRLDERPGSQRYSCSRSLFHKVCDPPGDQYCQCAAKEQKDLVAAGQIGGNHSDPSRNGDRVSSRGFSESPQRLQNDRDDHGLDSVENPGSFGRRTVPNIKPRDDERDGCRGQNEGGASGDQSASSRTELTDMHHHFGRVRTWDEIGDAQQIEKMLISHPRPPSDDLVAEQRDVRGRSAERGCAKP